MAARARPRSRCNSSQPFYGIRKSFSYEKGTERAPGIEPAFRLSIFGRFIGKTALKHNWIGAPEAAGNVIETHEHAGDFTEP